MVKQYKKKHRHIHCINEIEDIINQNTCDFVSLCRPFIIEPNLVNKFNNVLNNKQQQLDLAYANLKALNPSSQLVNQRQKVVQLQHQLKHVVTTRLAKLAWQIDLYQSKLQHLKIDVRPVKNRVEQLQLRLQRAIYNHKLRQQSRLDGCLQALTLLDPHHVLKRGYAILQDSQGKVIQSVKQTKHHARVNISLADGKVSAIIDKHSAPEQAELI